MITLFERRGFELTPAEDGMVDVSKPLGVETQAEVPAPTES
jgi:hypothetical protein